MTVAEGLKRFRKEKGLTQEAVAAAIGIHRQAYTRYESGGVLPIITVLIKMADVYNVTIDYLVGRTEKTNNDNDIQDNKSEEIQGVE